MNAKFLLGSAAKQTSAEEVPEPEIEVQEQEGALYFYTDVSKRSVLELNKKMRKLSFEIASIGRALDIPPPPIKLYINSPGGSLLDAFGAVDVIKSVGIPVHSIIEGTAASAATLMSVVADERSIRKNSFMLIHQLSAGMWGTFEAMKDDMTNANVFMDRILAIYAEHTKITKSVLKEILKRDIYFDAKECLKLGLVDKIIG